MSLFSAAREEWNSACAPCTVQTVYQDPRWLELIETVYPRLKVHRLICKDLRGETAWLLPLVEIRPLFSARPMLISLPFGNYGGFITLPGRAGPHPEELEELKTFFAESSAFALEIRAMQKLEGIFTCESYFSRFELPLPRDPEILFRRSLHASRRNHIRRAEREGIECITGEPEAAAEFIRIYESASGDMGTPVHHRLWFHALTSLFREETQILLARRAGRFVGAALMLQYNRRAYIHSSFALPGHRHLPILDKLDWEYAKAAIEKNSADVLDFGRTRPLPGKLAFKREWGAEEIPFFHAYLLKPGRSVPRILPENKSFAPALWAWRRMPVFLQRRLGALLRPRIPT